MKVLKPSYDEVIEGNIKLHREEAKFYDCIHKEIWNSSEQKRLWKALKFVASQIDKNTFKAIDFGAGTGNITEKLLNIGFKVTAIDLSKEMCGVLKTKNRKALQEGKLQVLNINFDKTQITGQFDLVTCYSVLHHLPDYIETTRKLSHLVKEGGVFYIDHEAPQMEAKEANNILERIIMFLYWITNKLLQNMYSVDTSKLDYTQSDVHKTIDYRRLKEMLKSKNFKIIKFESYYNQTTWFKTPLTFLHKMIVGSTSTIMIAKKREDFA